MHYLEHYHEIELKVKHPNLHNIIFELLHMANKIKFESANGANFVGGGPMLVSAMVRLFREPRSKRVKINMNMFFGCYVPRIRRVPDRVSLILANKIQNFEGKFLRSQRYLFHKTVDI